jgi:hypothetical protein
MGKKSLAALLCATMAMTACMLPATAAMADEPLKIEFFSRREKKDLKRDIRRLLISSIKKIQI